MGRKVLITGGAGFIGSTLCRHALKAGWTVSVLDDLSNGHLENIEELDVDIHVGSILDTAAVDSAMENADAVVHLAALGSVPRSIADPITTHLTNATGTLAVLEAVRRNEVRYVAAASSSSVYGKNPETPKRETQWVGPLSPYAVSKLCTEHYVLAYQTSFNLSTLALRLFNVYGPRQRAGHAYAAVVPRFTHALMTGSPLEVYGDGFQSRDFTYVDTVSAVFLSAINQSITHPQPVNLAFGTNTTLNQLITTLEEETGIQAPIKYLDPRPGDVPHSLGDGHQLQQLFPEVEPVPLNRGIGDTLDWFRRQP